MAARLRPRPGGMQRGKQDPVIGLASRNPGVSGIVAWVPTLPNTRSAVSVRSPPSRKATWSVRGATKAPSPTMSSSAAA
jgi:hypothetical protein